MVEECYDAFRSGRKEEALKLLQKLSNPQTVINSRYSCAGTILIHAVARRGWEDVCKVLAEEYNYEPTAVDDCGRSPLHIACEYGNEELVKYLVTLPSVLRRINDKDRLGRTPLHHACQTSTASSVIETLLETNAVNISEVDKDGLTPWEMVSHDTYGVLSKFANKIDWSTQLPVKSFFSVFLVGNSGVGKSTLAAAMQELTRSFQTQNGRISNVEELTAGIVPTQCRG